MPRISASILSFMFDAQKKKLPEALMIERINKALEAKKDSFDIVHLDIEDGKFVKYKSFTPTQLRKIRFPCKREAHFMVLNYKKYIKDYFLLADMFIFHEEVLKRDFQKTIDFLHKNKKFVGISINPDTPLDEIKYLDKIDLILVMSVYPGRPGQKFIETTPHRLRKLKELRQKKGLSFVIEVDGGIHKDNISKCRDADIVVMGTGLFGQ